VAGKGAVLSLKITGDAHDATAALNDVEDHSGRLSGVMGKMGAGMAAGIAVGGAALVALGKQSFDAASDLQQSSGAIETVFGKFAEAEKGVAADAAEAVGLSTSQWENMATIIGSQLKNAGMSMEETTGRTEELIQQGADMAAVFGGTASDAVDALSSALKGEMDPIERYGVTLNQTAIQTEMAAEGTDKLTGAAANSAKTQAILALISKQTAETTGQWAAQSGTAAEAQQILGAKVDNIEAKIGGKLLPAFAGIASWISDKVLPAVDGLTEGGGPLGDMFATVSGFVTGKVVPAVTDLYNWLAPKIIPIFADVAHIIQDVAVPAFKVIWSFVSDYVIPIFKSYLGPALEGVRDVWHTLAQKIEENKGKFQEIYDKIKPFLDFLKNDVAPFIGGTLKISFEVLGKVLGPIIDMIGWILGKAADVVGFIGKVGGFLFGGGGGSQAVKHVGSPLVGAARGAAPLRAASSSGGAGTGPTGAAGLALVGAGDTYNITISGVLNADDAAEQIRRLLERNARMTGRTLAAAL
jgi:hypothetical protein